MAGHRFKVGVDFGTTFSGVAYIDTAKPDDVNCIMNWPGERRNFEKVPTEISYNAAGEVHKWGYEIKDQDERLAWFKLLLDPSKYVNADSSSLSRTLDLLPDGPVSKQPVDVVSDYLSCLRKHTLATLAKTYPAVIMRTVPISYTITVPAMWSDTAKSLTLDAAVAAGFGSKDEIELMSEPDAAAAWTILRDIQPTYFEPGSVFVVVDCGGGTIDLISYEIVRLTPYITLREAAAGRGDLCGSTFLNSGFEELVISCTGKGNFDQMRSTSRHRMLREFEQSLKRNFTNSEEEHEFICTAGGLPDSPETHGKRIECGEFIFSRQDMINIFDPVINRIIPLVQQQIDTVETQHGGESPISAVLLVGGFGASQYLYQRLKAELSKRAGNSRISPEILCPLNAWSAVARGAALGIHITTRRARRYYGTTHGSIFQFGKHPMNNLYICRFTGEIRCKGCMKWSINYDDELSEDNPITVSYVYEVRPDRPLIFTDDLWEYSGEKAPEYLNQNYGGELRKLCTITSDLTDVPKSTLPIKRDPNGEPYYEVHFNLVITLKSAMLAFHFEFEGRTYGATTAEYLHDLNFMKAK